MDKGWVAAKAGGARGRCVFTRMLQTKSTAPARRGRVAVQYYGKKLEQTRMAAAFCCGGASPAVAAMQPVPAGSMSEQASFVISCLISVGV